jgi:hypothetical protein
MNPPFFRATYSLNVKITSAVILAILFLAGALGGITGLVVSGTLIPASLLLVVTGFSVQRGNLVVHSLLWSKSFDLCELVDIRAAPGATLGSLRAFGSGGLFASIGYFSNQVLGNYLGYITDPQNAVVVEFTNRLVVVTPEDPQGLEEAVLAEYRRIHL